MRLGFPSVCHLALTESSDEERTNTPLETDSNGRDRGARDHFGGPANNSRSCISRIGRTGMRDRSCVRLAWLRKAAAEGIADLGQLPPDKAELIVKAADESGASMGISPAGVGKTAALRRPHGTANEFISNRAPGNSSWPWEWAAEADPSQRHVNHVSVPQRPFPRRCIISGAERSSASCCGAVIWSMRSAQAMEIAES